MKKFDICEEGNCFVRVEARTPEAALRKAAKKFPRRAADYNMERGDKPIRVKWIAWEREGGDATASAELTVPSAGTRKLRIFY